MKNKWTTAKTFPTIEESNVYTMIHDYIYNHDRSPYYAEIISENHIRFTEAFNTIIAVIVDIQRCYSKWVIDYTVYDEGEVIDHKSFANPSNETIELISVLTADLVINDRQLYNDSNYIIQINVDCLSKSPSIVVKNRHKELIGEFVIDQLINASSIDQLSGDYNDDVKSFVLDWSKSRANNDDCNIVITNGRRAFLTADWFILQQIQKARFLPHEVQ